MCNVFSWSHKGWMIALLLFLVLCFQIFHHLRSFCFKGSSSTTLLFDEGVLGLLHDGLFCFVSYTFKRTHNYAERIYRWWASTFFCSERKNTSIRHYLVWKYDGGHIHLLPSNIDDSAFNTARKYCLHWCFCHILNLSHLPAAEQD